MGCWGPRVETNSKFAPENQWLEDEFSFWDGIFSGFSGAMLVSGRVSPLSVSSKVVPLEIASL